jgi:hypothetical protein
LNVFFAPAILSFTVMAALLVGIFAAYGAVIGILNLLGGQAQPRRALPSVLVPSETHASGD